MASRRTASKPMDKKIPKNPRYANVKSTIDTGPASLTAYNSRIKKKRKYAPKAGENFKRIRPEKFALLLNEDRIAAEESQMMGYGGSMDGSFDSANLNALMAEADVLNSPSAYYDGYEAGFAAAAASTAQESAGESESAQQQQQQAAPEPSTSARGRGAANPPYRPVNVVLGEGQLQPDGADPDVLISSGRNARVTQRKGAGGFDFDDNVSTISAISRVSDSSVRRTGGMNSILTGDYEEYDNKSTPRQRGMGRNTATTLSQQQMLYTSGMTSPVDSYLDTARSIDTIAVDETQRYLLLDVRLPEQYEQFHIVGALSYPAAMLSRATNYFTQDVYAFKNKDERLIIVYDNDETVAAGAAKVFFEKGVDNIVMLSGGIKGLLEEGFDELLVGSVPEELYPPPEPEAPSTSRSRIRTSNSTRRGDETGRSSYSRGLESQRSYRSTASSMRSTSTSYTAKNPRLEASGYVAKDRISHNRAFR